MFRFVYPDFLPMRDICCQQRLFHTADDVAATVALPEETTRIQVIEVVREARTYLTDRSI